MGTRESQKSITSIDSMLCCASKKTLQAVAEPIEYGLEPETSVKKAPTVEVAKPADVSEETASTTVTEAVPPALPQKQHTVPPLEEPNPLQAISMSLGQMFEKVAESARGVIEKVAAPASAPLMAAPAAAAPAAAFETSAEGVEEATETTAPIATPAVAAAPATAAPAPAAAAPAPAADSVRQTL